MCFCIAEYKQVFLGVKIIEEKQCGIRKIKANTVVNCIDLTLVVC
jgi:hypothetical protein